MEGNPELERIILISTATLFLLMVIFVLFIIIYQRRIAQKNAKIKELEKRLEECEKNT